MLRRLGRYWWIGGSVAVVGFAVIFTWLAPVLLEPVFNKFEELPPGKTRSQVLRLGERAGVDIGHVYRVDASRRSTAVNAYVNGLGPTKRVVIYDNTLRELRPDELRSVVAHELGHVKGDDIVRGIAWVALAAPLGVLFIQLATGALSGAAMTTRARRRRCRRWPSRWRRRCSCSASSPTSSRAGSRRRADTFALELTDDPRAFIDLQKQLAITNVADPDPPAATQWLFGTHPDTMQRIGAAVAFAAPAAPVKTVLLTVGRVAGAVRRCRRPLPQAARPLPAADRGRGARRRRPGAQASRGWASGGAGSRGNRARLAGLEPLARRAPARGARPLADDRRAGRACPRRRSMPRRSGSRSARRPSRTSSPGWSSSSSCFGPRRSSPASRTTVDRRADPYD